MAAIPRVKTGVPGLDNLIGGGIPETFSVGLKGAPGTGKTLLSLQYLIQGAQKYDEVGFYISFEESRRKIEKSAAQFDWALHELIDEKIFVERMDKRNMSDFIDSISDMIDSVSAKRIVIDSIDSLNVGDHERRDLCTQLLNILSSLGATTIIIRERDTLEETHLSFDVIDFILDGLFILDVKIISGVAKHYIYVEKMRATPVDKAMRPLLFTDKGIYIDTQKVVSPVKTAMESALSVLRL